MPLRTLPTTIVRALSVISLGRELNLLFITGAQIEVNYVSVYQQV